jgi:hypothetical protein
VKRSPIVTPVEIETDALAEFAFVDFAPPPLIENVLIAGEDSFNTKHDGAIGDKCALLE